MKVTFDSKSKDVDWNIIEAIRAGKMIQFWDGEQWKDYSVPFAHLDFALTPRERRIKPHEPQYRAWRAEEAIIGCQIRSKVNSLIYTGHHRMMLLYVCPSYVVLSSSASGGFGMQKNYMELLSDYEFSIDGGRSWEICGVLL
jgi:hypothetical protein